MFARTNATSFICADPFSNVASDSIDGYISNMFAPFSKTWIDHSERRAISSLDIVFI